MQNFFRPLSTRWRTIQLCLSVALLFSLSTSLGGAAETKRPAANWEHSVVQIDIKRKNYDFLLPWTTPLHNAQKYGVVLSDHEILTTAESLDDRTLLRVQKDGRGKWFAAQVSWIDYIANIALLAVDEAAFWTDMVPVELANPVPTGDAIQIVRWRNGKLENRRADFNQFNVEDAKLSWVQYLQIELNSEINGAGWSQPAISGGKVIGLICSQNGNSCKAIPSSFIRSILDAQKKGSYRGLGYFDFVWQISENPTTFKYLKFDGGEQRGVVVIDVPEKKSAPGPIRPRDIILQVDGFDIDNTGDYKDPDYGHVLLENLATRNKWAGDNVRIKISRDGKTLDLDYKLPKVDVSAKLVPEGHFDQPPEYLLLGGLVFQPLETDFLRSWGGDWRRRAPFRLSYYNNQPPTPERPSLVLLSQVLPDAFNLGYQEYRYLVVDTVNNEKISKLEDIKRALQKPIDGYHVIKFQKGDSLQKIILDAGEQEGATQRVLSRYGIEKDHFFVDQSVAQASATPGKSASAAKAADH